MKLQNLCFNLSSARISQIGVETDDNGKIPHLGGTHLTGSIASRKSEAVGDAILNWLAAEHQNCGLKLYTNSTKIEGNSEKGI